MIAKAWPLGTAVLVAAILAGAAVAQAQDDKPETNGPAAKETAAPTEPVVTALTERAEAAAQMLREGKLAEARRAYTRAIDEALNKLDGDAHREVVTALRRTLERAESQDDSTAVGTLSMGTQAALMLLQYEPILESRLPKGFPRPGPVGEVVIKQYPEYRMARVDRGADRDNPNAMFMPLFRHIKRNHIAMTAPVEIQLSANDPSYRDPRWMAFLYEEPTMGRLGRDGVVEVVDVPAMTVASLGVRGGYEGASLDNALKRLDQWLDQHSDEYEPLGPPRQMGYNSPMVPSFLRYFEVQVPVRPKR